MTGLPKTELAARRRRTWPVRFTGFELRCRFQQPLRTSAISETAIFPAFPGTDLSLAGVNLMHKTRLQPTNF